MLIGNTVSGKCLTALKNMGFEVILLPPFSKLQKGVSTHADMLLFFHNGKIITHFDYYNQNKTLFDALGREIITTDEHISSEYPNDILFNAVLTHNNILFAKTQNTSKKIKELCKKSVCVKQGYTACSTCKVADKAFITTDSGLYKAYTQNGIDALLVDKKGIVLPLYDCGFIGGASIVTDESVCFFGDIKKHKDYMDIDRFVKKYGKNIVSLSDEKLTDVGGCVVL